MHLRDTHIQPDDCADAIAVLQEIAGENNIDEATVTNLTARADAALYQANRTGRKAISRI